MLGQSKSRERALLFRSLEVLFSAGVSLPRSLRVLAKQTEDKSLSRILSRIEKRLLTGSSFSNAIREEALFFNDHSRRTIEVAEVSGSLPQVLRRLSEYEEKTYKTELQLRQALIYPCWIMLVCLIFVVWVPPYLFGELFKLLESSGLELLLLTRLVLGLAKITGNPIFYIVFVGGIFAFVHFVAKVNQSPQSRFLLYRVLHGHEFLSRQLTALATCKFARCLEMMAEAGVPITQSLKLAGNAAGDPILKRLMPEAINNMLHGATLEEALSHLSFFPKSFMSTIRLGEESGALPRVLSKIVVLYETELEYRANSIIAVLEPLAMLLMGIIVAIFIVATMSPLMQLVKDL